MTFETVLIADCKEIQVSNNPNNYVGSLNILTAESQAI